MPLTNSPNSFLITANEHLPHWTSVNAALGATPLLLRAGYTLLNFTADRDLLQTAVNDVTAAIVARNTAIELLNTQKLAIRALLTRFRAAVSNTLQNTAYARSLPTLPSITSIETRYLEPFEAMRNLWTTLNALGATVPGFTPPLILGDGTTLVTYSTTLSNLRAAYRAVDSAETTLKNARERRNDLLPNIRARLNQYHAAVLNQFGPGHAFVESMPRLSAPAGATPKAVQLTGVYRVATADALLEWTPSDNPNIASYSVRGCAGAIYDADAETVVKTVDAGDTSFATPFGLAIPGATVSLAVYVVLSTGNEKRSNVVKITRPPAP